MCSSCQTLTDQLKSLKEEVFLLKQDLIKKNNLILQLERSQGTSLSMKPLSFSFLDETCEAHYVKRHLLDGIEGYTSYIVNYIIPDKVRIHKRSSKEVFYFIRDGEKIQAHVSTFVKMILKSTEEKTERLYQEIKGSLTKSISMSESVSDMAKMVAQRHLNMALIRGQRDELVDKVSQNVLKALV